MQRQSIIHHGAVSQFVHLTRAELFGSLFILGCANGFAARMGQAVDQLGWVGAVFGTFNISLIVLAACFAGVSLVLGSGKSEIQPADIALSAVFLVLVILPIVSLSWLAVTALSLYILFYTDADQTGRRGATILLATSVPMLWSRLVFDLFTKVILEIDAAIVGWILGTHRVGNLVEFADHSGNIVIWPACSSFANVSLAFLCWVALSQSVKHKWRPQDLLWCLLACASVITINATRISLMGLNHSYYEALHSDMGEWTVNLIIFILTVGICLLGVRREVFTHA